MGTKFKCPQCGGNYFGSSGRPGTPDFTGFCHGSATNPRCGYTWNRSDEAVEKKCFVDTLGLCFDVDACTLSIGDADVCLTHDTVEYLEHILQQVKSKSLPPVQEVPKFIYRTPEISYTDLKFTAEVRRTLQLFLDELNKELVSRNLKACLIDTAGFIEMRELEYI